MTAVLRHLKQERIRLTAQLDQVGKALAALSGGRTTKKRRFSATALTRIRSAQKSTLGEVEEGAQEEVTHGNAG